MDSTSSGQIRGRGRNKRVWTPSEDEKLIECLVELCVSRKENVIMGLNQEHFYKWRRC